MDLVTGGTGLIGTHLLYELVRQGKQVKAIKRSASNLNRVKKIFSYYSEDFEELYSRIIWEEGDVLEQHLLSKNFEGIDRVFHCAAMVSFSTRERKMMLNNNVTGTENVVNACLDKGIKKLCFVSSTAAIGYKQDNGEADETIKWKNSKGRSAYSVSKYMSEMEVWRGAAEGLNAVIVNPSIVIGPGDWSRSSSKIFETVWKGLNFYTYGVTGYVDVWDVVHSMITLMESDVSGERFLLTSENLNFRDLFNMVSESLNKKAPKIYAHPVLTGLAWRIDWLVSKLLFRPPTLTRESARSAHNHAYFSNKKIQKQTGISFKPVRQSISETAKIFLKERQKK